jgi:hypothetical protein
MGSVASTPVCMVRQVPGMHWEPAPEPVSVNSNEPKRGSFILASVISVLMK